MLFLPFSDELFYAFLLLSIMLVYAAKMFVQKWLAYDKIILLLSIIFILAFYPNPLRLFVFAFYSYGIYLLAFRYRKINAFVMCLLFALPMIITKLGIEEFNLSGAVVFAGISYVSFRSMSLYFDITDNSKKVRLGDFLSFLFFIPTLLIGPIDRFKRYYQDIHLQGYKNLNAELFSVGLQTFMLGLLQKYVLAEAVDRYWLSQIGEVNSFVERINEMFAYSFYLYFDFAGYSSLAVGSGFMLGIKVPYNFNAPFLAVNPQDFWLRWHKSLGDWLKDYFFSPLYKWLSGMKKLKPHPLMRQNIALFLTFLLMGLWNGFKWHLILSGTLFGLYSVVHHTYVVECRKRNKDIVFGNLSPVMVKWLSRTIMFILAAFSLYIFSGRLI